MTVPSTAAAACRRLDVTTSQLRSRSRHPRVVEARAVVAWLLIHHHHWTIAEVADWLGRHPGHVRRLTTQTRRRILRDEQLTHLIYACRLQADGVTA